MEISLKIRELRKNLELTQEEFAGLIGVNKKTIAFWENKRTKPSKSILLTICNKCNLPQNYFKENVIERVNNTVILTNSAPAIDRVEINYWHGLPAELKNPKVVSCWFDREIIENDWGRKAENLCIVSMFDDGMSGFWYPIRAKNTLIVDTSDNNINETGVYFATSQNNTLFWVREIQVLVNKNIEFRNYSTSGEVVKTYTPQQLRDVDFKIIGKIVKNMSFVLYEK